MVHDLVHGPRFEPVTTPYGCKLKNVHLIYTETHGMGKERLGSHLVCAVTCVNADITQTMPDSKTHRSCNMKCMAELCNKQHTLEPTRCEMSNHVPSP